MACAFVPAVGYTIPVSLEATAVESARACDAWLKAYPGQLWSLQYARHSFLLRVWRAIAAAIKAGDDVRVQRLVGLEDSVSCYWCFGPAAMTVSTHFRVVYDACAYYLGPLGSV